MRGSRKRQALHFGLAAWLLVAATSSSLYHAHDGGHEPHSHHLGAVALAPDRPVVTPCPEPHRHLIVLGIEFLAEGADSCPPPADLFVPAFDAVTVGDSVEATPPPGPPPALPAPAVTGYVAVATAAPPDPVPTAACPCAVGARSGVLRV